MVCPHRTPDTAPYLIGVEITTLHHTFPPSTLLSLSRPCIGIFEKLNSFTVCSNPELSDNIIFIYDTKQSAFFCKPILTKIIMFYLRFFVQTQLYRASDFNSLYVDTPRSIDKLLYCRLWRSLGPP